MATQSAERIKELLGLGLSNEVVATAVGVTPSYISQLMSDETFSQEVISLRTQALSSATTRDRSWDGLEDKLLGKIHEAVDSGLIYKQQDVLRILSLANRATRRGTGNQDTIAPPQTIVNITLPTVAAHTYNMNSRGEVIELTTQDGRTETLVTMPAAALMQKLSEQHQGNKQYAEVSRYLPASRGAAEEDVAR